MTKSELVDQVAGRAGVDQAGCLAGGGRRARDRRGCAASRQRRYRVGIRQVPRQPEGRARGRQPAHRRTHPDRRLARPALHRRQRLEERGEGSLTPQPFGDTLAARVAERGSQLVLGLDPDPGALWPGHATPRRRMLDARSRPPASAVLAHCRALIDATAEACVAVKLQLARFEAAGHAGRAALGGGRRPRAERRAARDRRRQARRHRRHRAGLRRMRCSGGVETPFGAIEGLGRGSGDGQPADGRGCDRAVRRGCARGRRRACWCSSARPTRERPTSRTSSWRGRGTVWERVAAIVDRARPRRGRRGGLSDVGAFVGATVPAHLARARELMPSAAFLLPGVGAQGGRVEDLAPAFATGRAGGLVSASRSIAGGPSQQRRRSRPRRRARIEAERLRDSAWALSEPRARRRLSTRPAAGPGRLYVRGKIADLSGPAERSASLYDVAPQRHLFAVRAHAREDWD